MFDLEHMLAHTIDPDGDRELLRRFGEELEAVAGRGPVCLELPPIVAWNVLALLQLALRHPLVGGTRPGADGRMVIAALRHAVAAGGALAEVAARGDGPIVDPARRPTDC